MGGRFEELPGSELNRYFYEFSHLAVRGIARAAFLLRVEGADNIPEHGAAILASNHLHGSDTVFIPAAVPDRHVTVLGREGVMNPLFKAWGALSFPRPEAGDMMSLEAARQIEAALKQQRLVQIYVPGTRQPGNRPSEIKRGAAYFSRRTNSPIIPTIIKGSDNLPGQRVRVRFAKPLAPPEVNNKQAETELSQKLAQTIQAEWDAMDLSVFGRW